MNGPIAIDARKLADYGIGTYLRGLLGALAEIDPERRYVVLAPPGERAGLELPERFRWVEEPAPGYSLAELFAVARRARQAGAKLLHAPHYVIPLRPPCPVVVTVHDLIHLAHPELLPRPLALAYARVRLARAARLAARVVTVSETVARELVAELGVSPGRMSVIPNGVDERFRATLPVERLSDDLAELGLAPGYLLFVGNPKGHKNLPRLLDAYQRLQAGPIAPPPLVLVGARGEAAAGLQRELRRRGLGDQVRSIGFVREDALPALYQGAVALVFVTLAEGFGLPLAEALAAGTPVVTSDLPVHREVTGGAAELVDPRDPAAIAAGIARLLAEPELRAARARAGRERAARYRWSDVARRTLAAYDRALGVTTAGPGASA